MNTISKSWLIVLSALSLTTAHASEPPPILNLREIEPVFVAVFAKDLVLGVAGRPPYLLRFTNSNPSLLKHSSEQKAKMVQVTFSADLVGHALVSAALLDSKGWGVLSSGSSSKVVVLDCKQAQNGTYVSLSFETEDQATAAGKVLRLRDTKPSPLQKEKLPAAEPNSSRPSENRSPPDLAPFVARAWQYIEQGYARNQGSFKQADLSIAAVGYSDDGNSVVISFCILATLKSHPDGRSEFKRLDIKMDKDGKFVSASRSPVVRIVQPLKPML